MGSLAGIAEDVLAVHGDVDLVCGHHVVAGTAVDDVAMAVEGRDAVVAGAAGDDVVAGAVEQAVAPGAAGEVVVTHAAHHLVPAGAAPAPLRPAPRRRRSRR